MSRAISILADRFTWAYNNSANWYDGSAYQGSSNNGDARVGVILFSTLRDQVSWSEMVVKSVQLWVKFGDGGTSHTKVLSIFTTAANDTEGLTGLQMIGLGTSAEFGLCQVASSTDARNSSEVITFSANVNGNVFQNWRRWIEDTARNGLALYLAEGSKANAYSPNFMQVVNAGLLIEYDPKGSTGTVTPSSVDIGSAATLRITPITADQAVTHTAQWKLGSASSEEIEIAAGVTASSYSLPTTWLTQLPNVTSGQATCILRTYVGGTLTGAQEIPFTVCVPSVYAPVINSFAVKRYATAVDDQGQPVYVDSLSGNKVRVSIDAQIDWQAGVNTGTASIEYYPEDDETDATTVSVPWSDSRLSRTNDRDLIPVVIDLGRAWVFRLTVTNGHSTETATARVEMSWAPLHIAGTGYGVGIGMYSDGTRNDKKFQVAWPAHMLGGIEGVTNYRWDEVVRPANSGIVDTGGAWNSGNPIYRSTIIAELTQTMSPETDPDAPDYNTRVHTIGTLPKLPSTVISIRGTLRTTLDNNVRSLPFISYTGDWAAAAMVEFETGKIKLLLGSDYDLVMSEAAPMVATVFVEYTISGA
jgi:hypothetical protein